MVSGHFCGCIQYKSECGLIVVHMGHVQRVTSSSAGTWWMVPRGKYNKSPGCRMASRMGSPMSLSVKFGLDSRGRASSGLLQRYAVQECLCTQQQAHSLQPQ